jgi:hypothetical protein
MGAQKVELLAQLERAVLGKAEVRRLHEILCFLRAYPDDRALLAEVERMLDAFERRRDLQRHRDGLANSGIAGTALRFRFFAATARRLARRWPEQLSIDWDNWDDAARLLRVLPLVALPAERAAFDEPSLEPRSWLQRYAGGDAAFLLRGWGAFEADDLVRDAFYDDLDPPLMLEPGPGTPCRTREKYDKLPVVYQTAPLSRTRPDLQREVERGPLSVRDVSAREADALIELARNCMLPRERDLEVFAYANRDDVRLVDCGAGVWFACIGVVPERRSLLEAVYAFLMLKNGVAVGYALCSALFASSEVAFNLFETFRGGETAILFGRVLAMVRALFGSDAFAIDPYQLGHGNDEGLASGAFWFYQKLGFRPRKREVARTMQRELARMRVRPAHRSSLATLKVLASAPVFWGLRERDDVMGLLSMSNVALHVSRYVCDRFGADRELARETCMCEGAARLGVAPRRLAELRMWERWAPLVASIPGVERWTRPQKRALVELIRAKGDTRESDFVPLFEKHRRLRTAVERLARGN